MFDDFFKELFDESCKALSDELCDELFDELCCERCEEIGDNLLYEVLKIGLENAAVGLRSIFNSSLTVFLP